MPNFGWVHKERILEDLHHRFIDEPQNKLNSCKLIFLTNNLDSCIMLMLQDGCWGERSLDWQKSAAWAPVAWGNGGLQQIAPTTVVGQCGISTFDKLIQISTKIISENGLLHFNCRGVELKESRAYIFLYHFASSGHFHKVAKMTTICTKKFTCSTDITSNDEPLWALEVWVLMSSWHLQLDATWRFSHKMWHWPLCSQEITWNIGKWGVLRINVLNLGAFYRQTRTVSFRVSNNRGVCQDGSSCCGTKAGKQGDISDPWQRCEAFRWLHFRPLFVFFFKGWFC